eukprot:TRINITY_DN29229_c0_g1_i1.p1 TRINITY_DN29229_c0_g1~~TRINITY_DN29229_c0_g1_i1.p1  ORF type:complete len:591 (-),score=64.04 TRINITY_DN29229_c0_g1_i1:1726-3498(-)
MSSSYAFVIAILYLSCVWGVYANLNAKGFIRTQGTKFVDANCEEYVFNGWNSWEMIEAAIGRSGYADYAHFQGKEPLEWMMDTAVAANMNTFRIFGHGHDAEIMTLQFAPGQYDESALHGLDRVLDLARQRNLKVILTFADNWKLVDSKWNYVWWSESATWADDFYYDESTRTMFKNHINFMVHRINSVNGVMYRDDSTIIAWNLLNEPRSEDPNCSRECEAYIQAWIDEMSDFLKSVDPNHMVTIGQEGFYGWDSGKEYINPDAWNGESGAWAMKSGQDFVPNHSGQAIDFAGIHIWVDNWAIGYEGESFFAQWVDAHMEDAVNLNKPLVIEEFGKITWADDNMIWERDPYFALAYQKLYDSVYQGNALQGAMWWEWESDEKGAMKEYDVKTYQSTWTEHIEPQSKKLAELRDSLPVKSQCVPGEFTSFDIVQVEQGTDQFVYYTYRRHLTAAVQGQIIFGVDGADYVEGISVEDCIQRCEQVQPSCDSVAYNEQNGACQLQIASSTPSSGFGWNNEGWATYWRNTGYYSECTPQCALCSQESICIQCEDGYLLDRENDPYAAPFCKPCLEFPENVYVNAPECLSTITK